MKKNILVTGSHRSGTTWVGRVIAYSKRIRYIDEPFNKTIYNDLFPFENMYEYINDQSNESQLIGKNYLESYFKVLHKSTLNQVSNLNSWNEYIDFIKDIKSRVNDRSVIKDPFTLFSAEWIYQNYDWKIIVLIRHPAAFVASLKVKDWNFDFKNFKNQPNLLKVLPKEYVIMIFEYSETRKDIVDQGILLWNIIYHVVSQYQTKYFNQWYFIKHEDISMNPIEEFKKIFTFLQIKMDKKVEKFINFTAFSSTDNDLIRNSEMNIHSWKTRLSNEDVSRVKIGTENVWRRFYSENDW